MQWVVRIDNREAVLIHNEDKATGAVQKAMEVIKKSLPADLHFHEIEVFPILMSDKEKKE